MLDLRPGNRDLIREINEALVLGAIRQDGPVARSRIVERTGLSSTTVTTITATLAETGLIKEASQGPSTGGRPPRQLVLNPTGGYAVGIHLTSDSIESTLVNLVGEAVEQQRTAWQPGTVIESIDAIAATFDKITAGTGKSPVLGVGLALSGMVDHRAGVVRHSGNLGWNDAPIRSLLSERLGLPVTVDNNVKVLATALLVDDPRLTSQDLIVVNIGPSLGMTLVFQGEVAHGAYGNAGRFAHTSCSLLTESRRSCHCGARDCLETIASEWGIKQELTKLLGREISLDQAAELADGDRSVRTIFSVAGRATGRAIANISKVVDPNRVILVGEAVRFGDLLLEPLEAEFQRVHRTNTGRTPAIYAEPLDKQSWTRGAAWQALSQTFQPQTTRSE